jgi:hypothetical protein
MTASYAARPVSRQTVFHHLSPFLTAEADGQQQTGRTRPDDVVRG